MIDIKDAEKSLLALVAKHELRIQELKWPPSGRDDPAIVTLMNLQRGIYQARNALNELDKSNSGK